MHFVSRPVQTMKPEALNPLMRTQALAQPQRSSHLPRAAGSRREQVQRHPQRRDKTVTLGLRMVVVAELTVFCTSGYCVQSQGFDARKTDRELVRQVLPFGQSGFMQAPLHCNSSISWRRFAHCRRPTARVQITTETI